MRAKEEVFKLFFERLDRDSQNKESEKISKLIAEDSNGDFFVGVREDYLSIYYKGMSIGKVEAYKNGGCKYTTSYYYANGVKLLDESVVNKEKGKVILNPDEFWDEKNFKILKSNVEDHVFGGGEYAHTYLEKICQQWLINKNNSNVNADWYYVDMEYVYKNEEGNEDKHPFGRADLIAIKREPVNGIYPVAFVELKVGIDAYEGGIVVPKEIKDEGKDASDKYRAKVREALKNNMWDPSLNPVKLGSGLASHVVDFMHFFKESFFKDDVRRELVNILKVQKKLGMISSDDPINKISNVDQLAIVPSIHIVTYSTAPDVKKEDLSEEAQLKYSVPNIIEMKEEFYKYFYVSTNPSITSSTMAVEELLKESDIQGLVNLKPRFEEFMKNSDETIRCTQQIGDSEVEIIFTFLTQGEDGFTTECIR